ncbi:MULTISPECIES: hypothetical protein, partial [Rhizobium/Agrobacterium group]|uniref:hypothetical protein n=1 Tax=Rhizobium/Agrobacterium group TaxID=227290 RepID=UPI001AEEE369
CMSNDLRRKTVTLETDIGCLHRRNLRPTRNAANCEPINVTTPPQALILAREPKANVERYDGLRARIAGGRHAS